MKNKTRNLEEIIKKDILKKFVFLAGPRQVGKTTLAKSIVGNNGKYLLYDDANDRRIILNKEYVHEKWVCLDEFHKFKRWKNNIKSVYDKYHEQLHLILTGSARLDLYQKSGDSLFGRYYLHHLHPFSLREINTPSIPELPSNILEPDQKFNGVNELLKFGGFPEPFLTQNEREHRRWSNSRRELLIREDLRDLTDIKLLSLVEQLMLVLPQRIGSLFSYRSLGEDLEVSTPTIQSWIKSFEKLYLVYKLSPYSKNILRSLKKQPKYYFYDWSQVEDEGNRFENFVASHLIKAAQTWTDLGYANISIHFIKDNMGREVDFLIVKDKKPWLLIEAKLAETQISNSLIYFSEKLQVPGIQILQKAGIRSRKGNILLVSANDWLGMLP